jgi:hypothetical protein
MSFNTTPFNVLSIAEQHHHHRQMVIEEKEKHIVKCRFRNTNITYLPKHTLNMHPVGGKWGMRVFGNEALADAGMHGLT